ncbi:MAG TPA: ATP-binding protein [Saprospiraceae bacterium]|nr:ATP-binding protein [Saprospiraceae bacterium]
MIASESIALPPGFRFTRLEVLNWGTFDREVWHIEPGGKNALLTGDIGSGKSTLVDAITTLLVPPRKITFNKAAGAESRERNLRSYVKGAYKNEKVEHSGKARDVYLREGHAHHTVLLARFFNAKLNETISLAQVLWMQNDQVRKYYVLAQKELYIQGDFSDFGSNINNLKKRLRQADKVDVFDSFTDYSNRFRQSFGIKQVEALELFYQTISMKSVGNLTDFVRERMLGQTNIQKNIDELVRRYQELTEAHQAVKMAREQYELLQPLVEDASRRRDILSKIGGLEALLEEIPRYFAQRRLGALRQKLTEQYNDWQKNEARRVQLSNSLSEKRRDLSAQQTLLAGLDVSQRLQSLHWQINQLRTEKERRQGMSSRYAKVVEALNAHHAQKWLLPSTLDEFMAQRASLQKVLTETEESLQELSRAMPDIHVRYRQIQGELQQLNRELNSLRKRPTQIPERNLQLRQRLLSELGLSAEVLPFVGELLRVRESASDWEGAIERLLHSFGLSLLVPDEHYPAVSKLVDRLRLKGKLVYLRTLPHQQGSKGNPEEDSLPHKMAIKGDTVFYDWLETELAQRYNYSCCETLEDFHRQPRALTKAGQIKSSRVRHTKDDRYGIGDRRRYILGWSNEAKIAALETEQEQYRLERAKVEQEEEQLQHLQRQLDHQRQLLLDLQRFEDFAEIDFAQSVQRLEQLQQEQRALEAESGELRTIQERIRDLESRIAELSRDNELASEQRGAIRNELLRNTQQMYELLELLEARLPMVSLDAQGRPVDMAQHYHLFQAIELPERSPSPLLEKRMQRLDIRMQVDDRELYRQQLQLIQSINGQRGSIARRKEDLSAVERRIVQKMTNFRNRYPEEARDIDADIQAVPAFEDLYGRLVRDDIPRHEERFRDLLKQGAIRGILSFKTKLEDYEREIEEKIESINQHLREINYNKGTYIRIISEAVRTDDIMGFKQDLRACLDNIYGDSEDIYTEEKFFQVKKLLDRFAGETEADSRWTKRVTDVRQWYTFGADERYRETDESKEYYSDSSGKSGGQKEKLAYTILASAIAFQFGLEWGNVQDRSFRFVVIDEAFGRGSDDSTRYGLELFGRLDLQLLIVTPLQKINVIENYIEAVHYVSNPSGQKSMVRNISKERYLKEKEQFLAKAKSTKP